MPLSKWRCLLPTFIIFVFFPCLIYSHPTAGSTPNARSNVNSIPHQTPTNLQNQRTKTSASDFPFLRRATTPSNLTYTFTHYLSLGDSYSAGPGWEDGDPIPGNDLSGDCMRRTGAWPDQLVTLLAIPSPAFTMAACSGANMSQILTEQITGPGAGSSASEPADQGPDLITLTMGGNENKGFARVIKACPYGAGLLNVQKCSEVVSAARAEIEDSDFASRVRVVLHAVAIGGRHSDASIVDVVVLVMGYPTLYNADTAIGGDCWMKKSRRASINGLSTSLNAVLKAAVEGMHVNGVRFLFVDPNEGGAWDGHRMCEREDRSWLQGLPDLRAYSFDDFFKGLFHPTLEGHRAMALAALEGLRKAGWGG